MLHYNANITSYANANFPNILSALVVHTTKWIRTTYAVKDFAIVQEMILLMSPIESGSDHDPGLIVILTKKSK
ncbi:unnamed protein product [Rhizophagus irregularis]|nr:unnamed protein product [Rhizophagus irregularis]